MHTDEASGDTRIRFDTDGDDIKFDHNGHNFVPGSWHHVGTVEVALAIPTATNLDYSYDFVLTDDNGGGHGDPV